MGTKIEWTERAWNPVHGCSKVSVGCTNGYAEKISHRFGCTAQPWNAPYAAENVQLLPERLKIPQTWRKRRRIFVNSISDLFHEKVLFEFIRMVFSVIQSTHQHTYQILTKRPERMQRFMKWYAEDLNGPFTLPFPNVWLGVSVEN